MSLRLALGPEGGLKQAVWVLESWGGGGLSKEKQRTSGLLIIFIIVTTGMFSAEQDASPQLASSVLCFDFWVGGGFVCLFVCFQASETLCCSDAEK